MPCTPLDRRRLFSAKVSVHRDNPWLPPLLPFGCLLFATRRPSFSLAETLHSTQYIADEPSRIEIVNILGRDTYYIA